MPEIFGIKHHKAVDSVIGRQIKVNFWYWDKSFAMCLIIPTRCLIPTLQKFLYSLQLLTPMDYTLSYPCAIGASYQTIKAITVHFLTGECHRLLFFHAPLMQLLTSIKLIPSLLVIKEDYRRRHIRDLWKIHSDFLCHLYHLIVSLVLIDLMTGSWSCPPLTISGIANQKLCRLWAGQRTHMIANAVVRFVSQNQIFSHNSN